MSTHTFAPERDQLLSELCHFYIFQHCLIIFFVLLAHHDSPMLPWCSPGFINLVGKHREPAVVPELHPAADDAYHACAAAGFRGCVWVPKPNAVYLPCQVLTIKS